MREYLVLLCLATMMSSCGSEPSDNNPLDGLPADAAKEKIEAAKEKIKSETKALEDAIKELDEAFKETESD